jgi:hypothetical protein
MAQYRSTTREPRGSQEENGMGTTKRAPTRQRRLPSREGAVVTTIALTPDLHRRALLAAADLRVTQTEIYRQALSEWLDRHERRDGRRV